MRRRPGYGSPDSGDDPLELVADRNEVAAMLSLVPEHTGTQNGALQQAGVCMQTYPDWQSALDVHPVMQVNVFPQQVVPPSTVVPHDELAGAFGSAHVVLPHWLPLAHGPGAVHAPLPAQAPSTHTIPTPHCAPSANPEAHVGAGVVVVVVVVVGAAVVVVVVAPPISVPGEQVPGGRQRELITRPVTGLV
jgi:hypothetical protein